MGILDGNMDSMGLGLGLLQMGQERIKGSPMQTGLLQTSLALGSRDRLQQAKMKAERKRLEREAEARRKFAQIVGYKLPDTPVPQEMVQDLSMPGPYTMQGQGGGFLGGQMNPQQFVAESAQLGPEFSTAAQDIIEAGPEAPSPQWSGNVEFLQTPDGRSIPIARDPETNKPMAIGGGGVSVSVGDQAKPISVGDLSKMVMPDGSSVPLGWTLPQAMAAGARALSADEQRTITERAKNQEIIAELDREVERAEKVYASANAAWRKDKGFGTKRTLDNAAERLRRARAGRANWRGEPSGDVARSIQVPGAIGGLIEEKLSGGAEPEPEDPSLLEGVQGIVDKYLKNRGQ